MFNNIRNREDLYRRFARAKFKVGCEVGVHTGKNALMMFKNIPGLMLYLVEPYADHESSIAKWSSYSAKKGFPSAHENARIKAHDILKGYNAKWLEMFSEDAVKLVQKESLGFVYIDGEHAHDWVMLDTILWARKVRSGGIVSGHDYDKPGVKSVVDHYVKVHGLEFNYTHEKSPSWFFVKP